MISSLVMMAAILGPIPSVIKSIKERITPFRAVANGILGGIIAALAVMVIGKFLGVNVFDELIAAGDLMIKTLAEDPSFVTMAGSEAAAQQALETLEYLNSMSVKLLPATLCIFALLASYIDYIILSKIMKPGGIAPIPMTKLQEFDLPRRMVTFWCLMYLLALFLSNTEMMADNIIFLNVMVLLNLAFWMQGVSVIFMFCAYKRIPKAIAVIVVALSLITGFGGTLLRLLGFTDLLFGLKFRMKNKL